MTALPSESSGRGNGAGWRIGVDTGGTFTDLVAVGPDGEVRLRKLPSTPAAPAEAVLSSLEATDIGLAEEVDYFALGTTIATNAVIQRRGARVLFVTTAGFEDNLYIQRIDRRGLYDLQWVKSAPFAVRSDTIGVHERVLADGSVREPLTDHELDRVVELIRGRIAGPGEVAIAVCLLFSYVNDEHEQALRARLEKSFPGIPISISSDVAPVWREYERASTSVMDAYVHGLIVRFTDALVTGFGQRDMSGWHSLVKSNGGQVALGRAAERPVDTILSGLAGGMIAGAHWALTAGSRRAVTLDMGGTSADVGVVLDGELRYAGVFEVEWGIPIAIPTIDVTTIGAGGSSIASIDYGGLLRVGPESAGAAPGPASYGLGGDKPTITDANVVLGRLDPAYFLGGQMALDATRAADVIDDLARALGVERPDAAKAVVDVAIENMAGAVRLVTVDRGLDYRDFDLVAFGGAGPLHAVDMADRLGMRRVIVPPNPGLVSAYGAVIADERVDRRATLIRRLDGAAEQDLVARLTDVVNHAVKELNRHRRDLSLPAEVSAYVACRYIGQNYEQEILVHRGTSMSGGEFMGTGASSGPPLVEGLVAAFHDRHREVYGYDMQDQAIESVYVAATALARAPAVRADPYGRPAEQEPPRHRSVFAGTAGWVDALVVRRAALKPGAVITGPAIIEEADSTTWVPQRHHAKVHSSWCLIVEATAAPQAER